MVGDGATRLQAMGGPAGLTCFRQNTGHFSENGCVNNSGVEHERRLVRAFIIPERQAQFVTRLASERPRRKLLQKLAHFDGLDYGFATQLDPDQRNAECILRLLRRLGAPKGCYIVADDRDLDGQEMPLEDALRALADTAVGAFISCIPGKLAYFQ